jgi:hypothetical protein
MADFAGQLISTRTDGQMIFDDNVYDKNHKKLVSDILKDIPTAGISAYTVSVSTGATTSGYLKTYEVKQNNSVVGKIDIPKDFLVTSGSVVTGTWTSSTKFEPSVDGKDKALALVLNVKEGESSASTIYINVTDLGKAYTSGNGIDVSSDNKISVKISQNSEPYLAVGEYGLGITGLTTTIQQASGNAVNTVVGTSTDASGSTTIYGLRKYTDDKVAEIAKQALSVEAGNGIAIKADGTVSTISIQSPQVTEAIKVNEELGLYLDFENASTEYFSGITFDCGSY